MVVSIELIEENEWHLVLNEQFNIPNGSEKPYEVIDYLINKGIIFGVTYSDYGLHIHLENVQYVDDNYDTFLKVATDMLLFKKQFNPLVVSKPTSNSKNIQSTIKPLEESTQPEESIVEFESVQPVIDNADLKQPPKQ